MTKKIPGARGIRDIARLSGVSTATVSRVLNNPTQVRENTRDKVLAAIERSGYRPNAAAKALATRRTRTIAAVIPTLEHSIFAVFMNALEDRLATAGYSLVIATHGFDYESEHRRCSEVMKIGAEALVVSGVQHHPEFYQLLQSTRIPCICTSVHQTEYAIPSIGYDNHALAVEAIEFLASKGHRKISVIHGDLNNNDRMALRIAGVQAAAKKHRKLQISLFEATLGVAGGTAAAADIFAAEPLPDACLCCADVFALGLLFEAQRQGIVVPDQLSVMGFEDLEWARHCEPGLTTIALPAEQMGVATAASLVKHLDHGESLEHQLLDGEIVERGSTARSAGPA